MFVYLEFDVRDDDGGGRNSAALFCRGQILHMMEVIIMVGLVFRKSIHTNHQVSRSHVLQLPTSHDGGAGIMMLTPSGRFKPGKWLCLSMVTFRHQCSLCLLLTIAGDSVEFSPRNMEPHVVGRVDFDRIVQFHVARPTNTGEHGVVAD